MVRRSMVCPFAAAMLCSLLTLPFLAVDRASALTLTVNLEQVTTRGWIRVSVQGEGSCPELKPWILHDRAVEILFDDSCPILPPPPEPFELHQIVGAFADAGTWEIRLVDLTSSEAPPAVVDVVEIHVVDSFHSLELTPSLATEDDEVVANVLIYSGGCLITEPPEVQPGRIRIEFEVLGLCDPPPPPAFVPTTVVLGRLPADDYEVELFYNHREVAESRLKVVPVGACIPDETTLCLNDRRFRVTANWTDPQGVSGSARAVNENDDSGLFWFFTPDNTEMVVKVLDACATTSENFWVFAAGLTDVGVELRVEDTASGAVVTYQNALGTRFETITDTAAFDTCP